MVENVTIPDSEGKVVNNVGKLQGFIGISVKYSETLVTVGERIMSHPTVTTRWKFTEDELGKLLMGAELEIELLAQLWPPSLISVGNVPKPEPSPYYGEGAEDFGLDGAA